MNLIEWKFNHKCYHTNDTLLFIPYKFYVLTFLEQMCHFHNLIVNTNIDVLQLDAT